MATNILMSKNFGEVLQALLLERNLSVRKLAKDISLPHKTVNEWIGNFARMPREPEVVRKIADYFNVSVHFLLFGEEDPRSSISDFLEKTELHAGLYEITIKKVKSRK